MNITILDYLTGKQSNLKLHDHEKKYRSPVEKIYILIFRLQHRKILVLVVYLHFLFTIIMFPLIINFVYPYK